jgi:hypothetical protein
MANGFSYTSSHEWANLGQGAPEVGPIPNAPPRPDTIPLPLDSLEYAPTTGVKGNSFYLYTVFKLPHTVIFSSSRGGGQAIQPHLPTGQAQPIYL